MIIQVILPKFRLNPAGYDLKVIFSQLGTPSMFTPGLGDFWQLNGLKNLHVTAAKHQAFFQVLKLIFILCIGWNYLKHFYQVEEGTPVKPCNNTNLNMTNIELIVDQPFLLAAVENSTRTLLMFGRVTSIDWICCTKLSFENVLFCSKITNMSRRSQPYATYKSLFSNYSSSPENLSLFIRQSYESGISSFFGAIV